MDKRDKIIVGDNFLERHVKLGREVGLSYEHVIVDREDWEQIVELFNKNPSLVDLLQRREVIPAPSVQGKPKFVVTVGDDNCWLTDGNIGDPPRTLDYARARRFHSEIAARAAISKALETHPLLFRTYKIVPIKK